MLTGMQRQHKNISNHTCKRRVSNLKPTCQTLIYCRHMKAYRAPKLLFCFQEHTKSTAMEIELQVPTGSSPRVLIINTSLLALMQ